MTDKLLTAEELEAARRSLDAIGEGDWTPQDTWLLKVLDHIAALEAKLEELEIANTNLCTKLAETERLLGMTEKSLARSQAAHRKTLAELQDGKLVLRPPEA